MKRTVMINTQIRFLNGEIREITAGTVVYVYGNPVADQAAVEFEGKPGWINVEHLG